jgi:hypothetical protein
MGLRKTIKILLGQTLYWPINWYLLRSGIAGSRTVFTLLIIIMMMMTTKIMKTKNEGVFWRLKY